LSYALRLDVNLRKVHNLLWACRRACGSRWGLKPKVVHWFYVALIQATISFTSLLWRLACQIASAKKRLSKVQRLACLGITGVICMTPAGAVEAHTGLPPQDLVIQGEVRSVAHCLWSLGCWSYLHPSQGQLHIDTTSEV
jgi:hypothetical protein